MQGMSRNNGRHLNGTRHISQSIQDILSTPLRTRRMLMEYGSELPDLVDHPDDNVTRIRVIMATAVALARWEPRISIDGVEVLEAGDGRIVLRIYATDIASNLPVVLGSIEI
ncbi:GPW/gp25 family protein [Enterobacter bugandensis]|nr:GPW/gp25 family protein [Enterobacter bugandensis]